MPTAEELAAIAAQEAEAGKQKELATQVNSVVATHLKQMRGKLLDDLRSSLLETLGPTIGEAIKGQFAEQAKAAAAGGVIPGLAGVSADPAKPSPEMLAMQSRLEGLENKYKNAEQRADAAERSAWEERSYSGLQNMLQGKVKPELLGFVADHLFKVQGRVVKHDDGSPLFKVKKSPLPGMAEEDQNMPLADGVDEWLRSKEAAPFLPPPSPGGNGRRGTSAQGRVVAMPGNNGGVVTTPQFNGEARTASEKTRRAMVREQSLAEQFPNLAR